MKLFLNTQQISKLLKSAYPWPRDYALFHVALATGFRAGDLLALKRIDVNVDGYIRNTIKITMQKTGRTAERTLPPACREAISLYLATRKDKNPFLFRSESNNSQDREGPMNRSSLQRIFKSYLGIQFDQEQLRGNACHVTRRSVAKIISDRAGRIEPATRFLGHTSIANTVAYLDMDSYGKQADQIVEALPWNQTT